jgi:hypothetical protein
MRPETLGPIDRLADIRPNTQRIILTEKMNDTIERFSESRMVRKTIIRNDSQE